MAKQKTAPILEVNNLAQIRAGRIEFGDLTLVVGPQASGKSILLQTFKLLLDRHQIFDTLQTQGYEWGGKLERFLDLFFGESMSAVWRLDTKLTWEGKTFMTSALMERRGVKDAVRESSVFYVPAQRVVTIAQGWPRNFQNFDIGDPYVLKSFSESLRQLMEREFNNGPENAGAIFPRNGKMTDALRKQIDGSIFYGASVELDKAGLRRRFMLKINEVGLPFMAWSAGQKEFMPLLLSLYHLIPSGNLKKRGNIDWVIIEEPEMGLHPKAIQTVLLLTLQLMQRGYRVVISTHSPVLLDLAWAIQHIKMADASSKNLYELFDLKKGQYPKQSFDAAIKEKVFRTYYFDRQDEGVFIRDISSLDAGSDDPTLSNWGGLLEFAGRAAEIVSKLPQND